MQLLKITNIPIQYNISTEAARLEMKQELIPKQRITKEDANLDIQSRNIQVRLDTTRMRESINLRDMGDFSRYYGSKGRQTAYQAIGDSVEFGNQMQQIQDGVSISQIVRNRLMSSTQLNTYTTFLPSEGTDISWEPQELNIDYQPAQVHSDWEEMRNAMDYIPGKFQVNITQYPKVQIEYLGSPMYVPPSADPNYQKASA